MTPLRKAVAEMLATPAVVAVTRMQELGQTVVAGQTDVARTIANELAMWKQLVAQRKIVIDGMMANAIPPPPPRIRIFTNGNPCSA